MITVSDAMAIGRLREGKILAGKEGLKNKMSTVTIMDIPGIADWLTGGELVISGVLFQQCFSRELVDALNIKGVAGIVTKEKFANEVDPALFAYCDNIGFPIILAPADCNWGQIMNPITNYIIEKPYLIIKAAQEFHSNMMRAMINGVSLWEMCNKAREHMSYSIAVMDTGLHLLGYTDDFDWKEYTRNLSSGQMQYSGVVIQTMDEHEVYIYSYSNMLLKSIRRKLMFYPVTLNHVKYGYVVIAIDTDDNNIGAMESVKIQQLGLFFALYATKQNEISNATRRFNGLIMDQLLAAQDLTHAQAVELLAPMDKKIHRKYYAVQFLYGDLDNLNSFVRRNNSLGKFHEQLALEIPESNHILIFEKTNSQILLIPDPNEHFDTLVFTLRELFLEATGMQNVFIGISESVPLKDIKTAFIQSEYAGNYLKSTNSGKTCYYYSDLGILKYFLDNKGKLDEKFLKTTYEKYIFPLKNHDDTHNTQLLETLELYITNNCSKTETEKQLFIHKNTLRARLATINKILDCDISSMEDLFNLQFALKLREFFEEN